MVADERLRLFPEPPAEPATPRPTWLLEQEQRRDTLQGKIAELESLKVELAAIENSIAGALAILNLDAPAATPPVREPAPRKERPRRPAKQKAPRVYRHPIHDWKPAERMRVFDLMQAAADAGNIDEQAFALGKELDVSTGAIKHQWQQEQGRRGLRG